MKNLPAFAAALSVLAACSSAPVVTTPAPVPSAAAPAPAPGAPPTRVEPATVARVTADSAPADWQLLDEARDGIPGMSVLRAQRELLAGRQPARTVLVAVIDGGVDTTQSDLLPHLWHNPREIPGNQVDDDHNGYVDDTWGWNFIGGPKGNINHETLELTRLYSRCHHIAPLSVAGPDPSDSECVAITMKFHEEQAKDAENLGNIQRVNQLLQRAVGILKASIPDSLSVARVRAFQPTGQLQAQAREIYLQLADLGATPAAIAEAVKDQTSRVQFGYDTTYFPRTIVGDNLADLSQRDYGNRDVMGPDALHGTHVSGIIGGIPDSVHGIQGVAQAVRIMMIRTIPDGDERDKDVANAIRYAVDNGAKVINMSFGKPYSPQKATVDAAVKYADAHGVLMVHAAGNDGHDNDTGGNFPTAYYLDGGHATNWIEVGALSWRGGDTLATSFSNYGQQRVDLFAPGQAILSTVPGNTVEREDGTSMASPMVAGLAALIMSYYPKLTAADVKRIILQSATSYASQRVARPGADEGAPLVPFGTLSVTGGIANAYSALQLAARESAARR